MAYEEANNILNQIAQSISQGRAASQAVDQAAPAPVMPVVTAPVAPVAQAPSTATPGSIGALGGGLLNDLLNGAKWAGKPFESVSAGLGDAVGAIRNLFGSHEQQNLDGTTTVNQPSQSRNIWDDLGNIWSHTNEHVGSDIWHGAVPNAGKLPGTSADIADVADFGSQLISPMDMLTAPLQIGGKLAAEGLARVPGIAGKVASYGDELAAKAAQAASEAHAASMPDPTEIPNMTDEQMQHIAAMPHVDEMNQDINNRADLSGGYVPPEAPKASQMLDDFMNSVKPNIVEKGTPPVQDPVMLHRYVSDALHSSGVEMSKTELSMMPYNAQVDFAKQLQPQVMQGIYAKEAQARGINFDDLLNRAKQEAAPAVESPVSQAQQVTQQLPHMPDNYVKPLSTYSPTMYRETSPNGLLDILPGTNRIVDLSGDHVYMANNKDLALGQGTNQGVTVEMDTKGLQGTVNTSKPGWDMTYKNGSAEFIGKHMKQSDYQNAVKSVTIQPNAAMDKGTKATLQRILSKWQQVKNEDGSTTFTRPQTEQAPPSINSLVNPEAAQQTQLATQTPATSSLVNPGQQPNIMDQLSMMLHGNGNTDLSALSHNPEVINPGQSSRFGQTRNEQPGQFTDIPSSPEGGNSAQAAGSPTAQNGYAGMSKGEMFQAMLKDSLKRMVGDRVSGAVNKLGFGSGLNLMNDTSRNIALNGKAAEALNSQKLEQFFTDYARQQLDKGITKQDMSNAVDAYEAGQPIDSKMQPFIDDLAKFQNEGVAGVHGGLHAEQAAGIAPNVQRPNYIHLSIDPKSIPKDDPAGILQQMKTVGMGYAKDRKFDTAAAAREAGYGVRDPISAVFDRLNQSQKDLTHIKTYTDLKHEGYRNGEVLSPEGFAAKKQVAPDEAKKYKQFTTTDAQHPLNGSYLKDGLHQYTTTQARMPWSNANIPVISPLVKGYDKLSNLYKHLTLYNPAVHNHNTFGNALISFGLHPKNYMDAEATLHGNTALGGTATPAMQDALHYANKTGALGNDSHVSSFDKIDRILDPTLAKEAKGRMSDMQNSLLWNREKALRLGVFKQAFEHAQARGMDREAAAHVARDTTNSHMVDYSSNNLSTFEKEIMSRLDPYYKWHKGNYALQAKNLIANPAALARMNLVNKGRNLGQQMITGQGQDQNIGGDKEHNVSLQLPMGNGTSVNYDPYVPSDEPFKIMNDSMGHFLYAHQNPLLRELENQLTNQQYAPTHSTAPVDKQYLSGDKYQIRHSGDSMLADIGNSIKHIGSTFGTSGEGAIGTAIQSLLSGNDPKYPKTPIMEQLSLDGLGGFAGSSPTSQNKVDAQAYLQKKYQANQEYHDLQQSKGYDPKTAATKHDIKQIKLKYGVSTVN